MSNPLVSVIMGSDSDYPTMKAAKEALDELEVPCEMRIISAHRTPDDMATFAKKARARGIRAIIAGAGGAAHLPGMVAAQTELPVIGVPVPIGFLQGQDALLSIVQMPKGVPVATVAIGNAFNAGLLAAQIVGASDDALLDRVAAYKQRLVEMVRKKTLPE
jgi:5-(carboxyamino)imidazole ribonucleotide mutase